MLPAVAGVGIAKKVGGKVAGKVKKLFSRKRKNQLKKVGKSIAGAVSGHSGEILDFAKGRLGIGGSSMPGGAPAGDVMGGMMGGGAAPGVHGHWTKAHGHVPSHWSPRRRPRMNPGNTRAMRRSIRRVTSGAKLYSHLFHIAHGRVPGTRVKVKRHLGRFTK